MYISWKMTRCWVKILSKNNYTISCNVLNRFIRRVSKEFNADSLFILISVCFFLSLSFFRFGLLQFLASGTWTAWFIYIRVATKFLVAFLFVELFLIFIIWFIEFFRTMVTAITFINFAPFCIFIFSVFHVLWHERTFSTSGHRFGLEQFCNKWVD